MLLSKYKNKRKRRNGTKEMTWQDLAWELRELHDKDGKSLEDLAYQLSRWAAKGAEITGRKGKRKITLNKVLAEEGK